MPHGPSGCILVAVADHTPRSLSPDFDDSPEEMLFQNNLQEFARRVGFTVGLEQGEKIDSAEAYQRIRSLWKELKSSHKSLLKEHDGSVDPPRGGEDG